MRFKEIFLENKDRRYCNITKVKKENMTLVEKLFMTWKKIEWIRIDLHKSFKVLSYFLY